ncbi:hypothetical protein Tco_1458930 [Tanacetum coccineum]
MWILLQGETVGMAEAQNGVRDSTLSQGKDVAVVNKLRKVVQLQAEQYDWLETRMKRLYEQSGSTLLATWKRYRRFHNADSGT